MNRRNPLSDQDRATLCARAPFLDVLRQDGAEPRRIGPKYVCRLRDEQTPSCHVWPPGVGRLGNRGWTWHDYGTGQSGDALGYLVDIRGLAYLDAARELAHLAGWWPEGLEDDGRPASAAPRRAPAPLPPEVPAMPQEAQLAAVEGFLDHLLAIAPNACKDGNAYLAARGCLPTGADGLAYLLPGDADRLLAARLAADERAPLFRQAGVLRPTEDGKPPRLAWWGRVCLLPCMTMTGRPAYLVGRRLDWHTGDRWGKYINQPCAAGAARWPYGLPMLAAATGRPADGRRWPGSGRGAGDLLLVEGALDALGAAVLGWPAVALLTRLQAHDYRDRHGSAARALEPLLPALLGCRRVLVVPDNDTGAKGDEGQALAARLVGWLRNAGARAKVATLADLGLVPADDMGMAACPIKDLADAARLQPKESA
jgi:hypothetical protein